MSNPDSETEDWRDRLERAAGHSGGCAELWEASEAARREDARQLTRRKLLGSLGAVGALGLAGCRALGPAGTQTDTPVPDRDSTTQTPLGDSPTPVATATPVETEPTPTESAARETETETETATPDDTEVANLLVYKRAETDDALFRVQFIPVVNKPYWLVKHDHATDEMLEQLDKRELVNTEATHTLNAPRSLFRLYRGAAYDVTDPTMRLKVKQMERLLHLMCKYDADIWGAYVQQGEYEGKQGQFLFVGQPSDAPERPCTEKDVREWVGDLYRESESNGVEPVWALTGSMYWAPEWKVACTFVSNERNVPENDQAEKRQLRRDIALYEKINDRQAAFVNRARYFEGPNSENDTYTGISMPAKAAQQFHRDGKWRVVVSICNEAYEAGQILNDPVECKGKAWSKPVIHEEYPDAYMKQQLITSLGRQLIARYRDYATADNVKPCENMCQESFEVAECLVSANYFFWKERGWDGGGSGTFCGSLSDIGEGYDKLWEGRCGDWSTALVNWCKKRTFDCWKVKTEFAKPEDQDHQVVLITPRDVDAKVDSVTRDEFGMVYDAWRHEGKPFWIPPQKDDDWDWGIGD